MEQPQTVTIQAPVEGCGFYISQPPSTYQITLNFIHENVLALWMTLLIIAAFSLWWLWIIRTTRPQKTLVGSASDWKQKTFEVTLEGGDKITVRAHDIDLREVGTDLPHYYFIDMPEYFSNMAAVAIIPAKSVLLINELA